MRPQEALDNIVADWGKLSPSDRARLNLSAEEKAYLAPKLDAALGQSQPTESVTPTFTPDTMDQPAVSRFGSGLYDTTVGPLVDLFKQRMAAQEAAKQEFAQTPGFLGKAGVALRTGLEQMPHNVPVQMAKGMLSGSGQRLGQAKEQFQQGDYVGAAGSAAAAVPVVGPMGAAIAEDIQEGNYAGAAGQTTGILASLFAPKIAKGLKKPMAKLAEKAEKGAAGRYERIMNPTTKGDKLRAADVAPELAKRKVFARSLDDLKAKADASVSQVGQQIDDAWANLPDEATVPAARVTKALKEAKRNWKTSEGVVPNAQLDDAITKTNDLISRVKESSTKKTVTVTTEQPSAILGPNGSPVMVPVTKQVQVPTGKIPVRDLRMLKQEWDEVGRQGGRFDGKTLADQTSASTQAIAADAAREALNKQFPEIAKLNKEYGFWKDVDTVATNTLLRRKGQAPSLLTDIAKGAGTVAGASHGGIEGAMLGRAAMGGLSGARRAPWVQTPIAAGQQTFANAMRGYDPTTFGLFGRLPLASRSLLNPNLNAMPQNGR